MELDPQTLVIVLRALSRALDDAAVTLGRNVADAADASPWLDAIAAAAHARCTRRAIDDARRGGELVARRVGRKFIFARDDLDAWLRDRAVPLASVPANDAIEPYAAALEAVRARRAGDRR